MINNVFDFIDNLINFSKLKKNILPIFKKIENFDLKNLKNYTIYFRYYIFIKKNNLQKKFLDTKKFEFLNLIQKTNFQKKKNLEEKKINFFEDFIDIYYIINNFEEISSNFLEKLIFEDFKFFGKFIFFFKEKDLFQNNFFFEKKNSIKNEKSIKSILFIIFLSMNSKNFFSEIENFNFLKKIFFEILKNYEEYKYLLIFLDFWIFLFENSKIFQNYKFFWIDFLYEIFYKLIIHNIKIFEILNNKKKNDQIFLNIISEENIIILNKIFCFLFFFKKKSKFRKFEFFFPFDIFENCDKFFNPEKLMNLKLNSNFEKNQFNFFFQKCKFCKDFIKLRILKFEENNFFLNSENFFKPEFKKLNKCPDINDFLENDFLIKEAFLDFLYFQIK